MTGSAGPRALAGGAAAGLAAAAAAYLAVVSGTHVDLDAFAAAAREVVDGRTPYTGALVPFVYPPAGVLVALVALGGPVIWSALSLLALARVVLLLVRSAWPDMQRRDVRTRACGVFAVLVVLEPTLLCLAFGQVGLLLLWMVVEGALARRGSPAPALIGVATAIKLTPAYLLVVLAAAGRWRAVAWSAVGALAATAAVWVVRPQVVSDYLSGGWRLAATVNDTVDAQNHSIAGLVRVLGLSWVWAAGAAVLVAAMAGAVAVRSLRRGDTLGGIAAALVGGLLVSPISWTHHWVAVYPALVLLLRGALAGRRPALALLVVGVVGLALWVDVLGRDGSHVLEPGERWPWPEVVQQEWLVVWGLLLVLWCAVAGADEAEGADAPRAALAAADDAGHRGSRPPGERTEL